MNVHVFYEDSRTPGGDFTLHDLVLACVADRIQRNRWDLKDLVLCKPMKGNANVLKACAHDVRRMKHAHIAAVLDGDELARLLNLRGNYCKCEARAAFGRIATDARLELFVLDHNIETLIETLGRLKPDLPMMTEALDKDRNARDRVFANAANAEPGLRTQLRSEIPSFDRLTRKIEGWLRALHVT